MQEGQSAGFDNVRAHCPAANRLAFVFRLDLSFPLGILADRDAANTVVTEGHFDAGDALHRLEDRVDRPIADCGIFQNGAVLMP